MRGAACLWPGVPGCRWPAEACDLRRVAKPRGSALLEAEPWSEEKLVDTM